MTPEAIAQQAQVNAIEAQLQKKMKKPATDEVEAMKQAGTIEKMPAGPGLSPEERKKLMEADRIEQEAEQAARRAEENEAWRRSEMQTMAKDKSQEKTQKVSRNVGMSAQGVRNNNQEWSVGQPGKMSRGNMEMGVAAGVGQAPTPRDAKKVARNMGGEQGQGMSVGEVKQGPAEGPPMDITPLVTALSTINNTLIGSLASIESRAKKNDINPALTSMNDFLSQINSSLPTPMGGGGPAKKATAKKKMKAKGKPTETAKMPAQATNIPPTIAGVITVLSQINTTLQTSLTAIESRLKKNDVNPALETLNDYLSQINGSLPTPAGGGGTRRSRVKKRKQTLRHRRA
jgi:hypothetical protein